MRINFKNINKGVVALLLVGLLSSSSYSYASPLSDKESNKIGVERVVRVNPNVVDIIFADNNRMTIDFYGENIFRLFYDNEGGILRAPESTPEAEILVANPRKELSAISVNDDGRIIEISSGIITIKIDKENSLFSVINKSTGKVVMAETKPIFFEKNKVSLTLKANDNEYFFGGGVQNGRFTHRGKIIDIENQNSWNDGGVASPNPFYWSTQGYAIMWNTFKKGTYDFDSSGRGEVILYHNENYLDIFIMVNDGAVALLNDFYQLTGYPVLVPKFGFYEGHLNAYNRDYWVEVEEGGVLFEDGKHYKESSTKIGNATKESLNGENNNYQFSARAVIDRYKAYDMPLGWILPNDGYGAGYGQDSTIDLNIANLRSLTDYAAKNGVKTGLWTQSDLYPKEGVDVVLQRDIIKEVRDAGVRMLKTDVAWVGAGYSFGLNGVADVADVTTYYGDNARPFIISLDGWAGTQRYATIWSGDQSGGIWEYIRFHIPTYIGSGLSGQPNISSDMDGIFGGNNTIVNTRDFQWKTFTPQQLNMDGWGSNPKYPHILGEPTTSINRMYLKLRSELMPYIYSVARESVDGLPMVRAMFLEYPNRFTYSKATQYQFLFGSNFLVAPIYQATVESANGDDVRDHIYLPEGEWIDYFSGEKYSGGVIINSFDAPLWKLPLFVKSGAIIPMTNPNNNVYQIDSGYRKYEIYPNAESSFTEYDDDGLTELYKFNEFTTTHIRSSVSSKGTAVITIDPTEGAFNGFNKNKSTEFVINVTEQPTKLSAVVAEKRVKLTAVNSLEEYANGVNVYFYDAKPNLNKFATKGSEFAKMEIIKNPQILIKLEEADITKGATILTIKGFKFSPENHILSKSGSLAKSANFLVKEENKTAYSVCTTWDIDNNADYYEIRYDGNIYSIIKNNYFKFDGLTPDTDYSFELRSVNKDGVSDWVSLSVKTDSDPLEFTVRGMSAKCSAVSQVGEEEYNLFDYDPSTIWHTDWNTKALPFELLIDMNSINTIERLEYIPRIGMGNGTLMGGTATYSYDKENWSEPIEFFWDYWSTKATDRVIKFPEQPQVRYIKLSITRAAYNFGSGAEIYVFKVPGTNSYIPGDINSDGKIDSNDLTSYTNYTGLRLGDSDFEGYVSVGDINRNNLIDAYDISNVAIKLDGGIDIYSEDNTPLAGSVTMESNKKTYKAGEEVIITVRGDKLSAVNALSFAMSYDASTYEYVTITPKMVSAMVNMTNDRLHTNGIKSLYPTFVNLGEKEKLNGSDVLFTITLKAKKNCSFNLKMEDLILVDKGLNTIH